MIVFICLHLNSYCGQTPIIIISYFPFSGGQCYIIMSRKLCECSFSHQALFFYWLTYYYSRHVLTSLRWVQLSQSSIFQWNCYYIEYGGYENLTVKIFSLCKSWRTFNKTAYIFHFLFTGFYYPYSINCMVHSTPKKKGRRQNYYVCTIRRPRTEFVSYLVHTI